MSKCASGCSPRRRRGTWAPVHIRGSESTRRIFVGSTLLVLCGAGLGLGQTINPNKLVDLPYSFNEKTIYWPNAKGFTHRKDMWKVTPQGYWYAAGGFRPVDRLLIERIG